MSTPVEILPEPTLRTENDYPFCPRFADTVLCSTR